ncbi:hypothetical protein ACFL2Z_01015 [Candidatus Eisenbacteria bacterium]|uniref:Transposase n=1 Tax=Eiseniibacteriota bacterium TaxID=2212470 RepID=A0ABV6YN38_UNCEI
MKTQKTKERFIELRAEGWSFAKIAKELKVSKQTLITWSKELGLEIANLKAIEMEALQEKYYMTKARKMELLGERLMAVRTELEKRDLSDIRTERLMDLLMKYSEKLDREAEPFELRRESAIGEWDLRSFVTWKP